MGTKTSNCSETSDNIWADLLLRQIKDNSKYPKYIFYILEQLLSPSCRFHCGGESSGAADCPLAEMRLAVQISHSAQMATSLLLLLERCGYNPWPPLSLQNRGPTELLT